MWPQLQKKKYHVAKRIANIRLEVEMNQSYDDFITLMLAFLTEITNG